jgi:3-dehydroquinate dehydratase II
MKLLILNGPNLNLLGTREPSIYGVETLDALIEKVKSTYPSIQFEHIQSNHEGVLIDAIQNSSAYDGIVFNAGGYTHTSVAIADALAAVKPQVIEVHLSNVHARESFRHTSLIAPHCLGSIAGFGVDSYLLAVAFFLKRLS